MKVFILCFRFRFSAGSLGFGGTELRRRSRDQLFLHDIWVHQRILPGPKQKKVFDGGKVEFFQLQEDAKAPCRQNSIRLPLPYRVAGKTVCCFGARQHRIFVCWLLLVCTKDNALH